jgi:hypothetical protein
MPRLERETLLVRIADLQETLRLTESEDVREAVMSAIADCDQRLRELTTLLDALPENA